MDNSPDPSDAEDESDDDDEDDGFGATKKKEDDDPAASKSICNLHLNICMTYCSMKWSLYSLHKMK